MKLSDLTGQKFGRLTVIERAEDHVFPSGQKQTQWRCKCDCGNEIKVIGHNLKNGNTQSCGCFALELRTKHNLWGSKVYRAWDNMLSRCFNPNATGYKNWGGRGITVFKDWVDSFDNFYSYVSKLLHFGEEGYSLDRINNDGNYEPGNIRWATRLEQTLNRRCSKNERI